MHYYKGAKDVLWSIEWDVCIIVVSCLSNVSQLALGLQDLGQFYHQPVKDANGTIILAAINYLPSTKSVNISQHVKWTSLGKVQRRSTSAADADALALDLLIDVTGVSGTVMTYEEYDSCRSSFRSYWLSFCLLGSLLLTGWITAICAYFQPPLLRLML